MRLGDAAPLFGQAVLALAYPRSALGQRLLPRRFGPRARRLSLPASLGAPTRRTPAGRRSRPLGLFALPAALTYGRQEGRLRAVGKHDRRNSMKMKRRKAQVKKKTRLKRQSQERKAATAGAKKPAGRKKAAAAAPPQSAPPPTTPTGTAPGAE